MRKIWPLLALGLAAFLLFALITFPASTLLGRLGSRGVQAAGVEGTVWRGRAQVLQVAGANVGAVSWNLYVLPLFTGRLKADIRVTRADGFAETVATISAGAVHLQQLTASLPLTALPPATLPGGWVGTANLRLPSLRLHDGWPVQAEGTVEIANLTGPARRPANVGNYKLTFPAPNSTAGDSVVGSLVDQGGPLQIAGTLQLKPDRSYLVEGLVATKPQTPPDVVNALQFLGPPDAQGRRQFSLAGTM